MTQAQTSRGTPAFDIPVRSSAPLLNAMEVSNPDLYLKNRPTISRYVSHHDGDHVYFTCVNSGAPCGDRA
ncbi:MAG TPA: hypothetical protein VHT73_16085 [Thermodesulfobacteriota bacterium]|nr:hypothetical protein [Thermodesulfobacteriota bacterium]